MPPFALNKVVTLIAPEEVMLAAVKAPKFEAPPVAVIAPEIVSVAADNPFKLVASVTSSLPVIAAFPRIEVVFVAKPIFTAVEEAPNVSAPLVSKFGLDIPPVNVDSEVTPSVPVEERLDAVTPAKVYVFVTASVPATLAFPRIEVVFVDFPIETLVEFAPSANAPVVSRLGLLIPEVSVSKPVTCKVPAIEAFPRMLVNFVEAPIFTAEAEAPSANADVVSRLVLVIPPVEVSVPLTTVGIVDEPILTSAPLPIPLSPIEMGLF